MKIFRLGAAVAAAALTISFNAVADTVLPSVTDSASLCSQQIRLVGEQVLMFQRDTGGWPKNVDMATPLTDPEMKAVLADKSRRDDSTIDNGATTSQIWFLSRLYGATRNLRYRDAACRGLRYLLDAQYKESGGWPQFWPVHKGYRGHITYNDNAMAHVLYLLRGIARGDEPFGGDTFTDEMRREASAAFDRGIDCILATQIKVDGRPTVWCQQHDSVTLAPVGARAFELPAYVSAESVPLVKLLMTIEQPDSAVIEAVEGAMRWFEVNKITGYRFVRDKKPLLERNARLVADPEAGPIWARYYDLEECKPMFSDRDGVARRHLEDLGLERRNGYAWYTDNPADLYAAYERWLRRLERKTER